MKIIFAGTPDFAAASLAAILEAGHQVIAVYTQPDRPAGRGKKLLKSPVKQLAESSNIPCYQPEKLTSDEAQKELAALNPDVMIVAAYGLLLPKAVLDIPRLGCINIHASLLPRWRGAAPIQRAIQAGDSKTGITIMQMDEGLDTGNMLLKVETDISPDDTGGSLHDRLAELGAKAILEYLDQAENRSLKGEEQDSSLSCYAHKLSKQEAQIDWNQDAEAILRTIRAFNPWPVAYSISGDDRVRIFDAEIDTEQGQSEHAPGTVISKTKAGIVIRCASEAIRIKKLQLPGAKAMSVEDFVNGGKTLLSAGEQLR